MTIDVRTVQGRERKEESRPTSTRNTGNRIRPVSGPHREVAVPSISARGKDARKQRGMNQVSANEIWGSLGSVRALLADGDSVISRASPLRRSLAKGFSTGNIGADRTNGRCLHF